jgi:hypothetical protein
LRFHVAALKVKESSGASVRGLNQNILQYKEKWQDEVWKTKKASYKTRKASKEILEGF